MSNDLTISPMTLTFAFVLVLLAMYISQRERLGLAKEIGWAVFRMVVQLVIVGYVLTFIFELDAPIITLVMMVIMILNAAWNAKSRAYGMPNAFRYSLIAMICSIVVVLFVLVVSGSLQFTPSQIIPINGMLVGNAMNVLGLSFRNLHTQFDARRQTIQEKLALGADVKQASQPIIREAIRGALQPTIDSTKTVGLVTLPGMMTGLILGGVDPLNAIMYQIMVYFMLTATASITSVVGVYLSYKEYFNEYGQLKITSVE